MNLPMAPLRSAAAGCGARLAAMGLRKTCLLVSLIVIAACGRREVAADDQRLLDYASGSYDKGAMVGTKLALGIHNGVPLIAEFPCSDVCPDDTVRILNRPPSAVCRSV